MTLGLDTQLLVEGRCLSRATKAGFEKLALALVADPRPPQLEPILAVTSVAGLKPSASTAGADISL